MQTADSVWHYFPVIIVIPLLIQLIKTFRVTAHIGFDVQLKPLALTTFALSLLLLLTQLWIQ